LSRFATAAVLGTLVGLAAGGARADITIGVAGPMTGPFAVLGQEMRAGVAAAVDDLNRAGGVNGQMLQVEVMDDACDAKTADAVANQLTGKGAVMVVGHICLSASLAGAAVYALNKIVEISPATTYPKYTDERPGPGIFRLAERDDQQGAAAGMFLASSYTTRNVAIVNDDSEYGKGLADNARKAMNAAGKVEAMTLTYAANATDFSDLVGKLKAAAIDAVFVGGSDVDVGNIVKAMRAAGLTTQVVAGDAIATNQFWQTAGAAGQGTLMTLPYDPRRAMDAATVVKAFRAAGVEPEGYVLPSYAAVTIWATAAARAKTTAFDPVVAQLASGTFPCVLGAVSFDAEGDADLPGFILYRWADGRFDSLKP
jgi:branched-chain amino acid transport system substrate-binding protein